MTSTPNGRGHLTLLPGGRGGSPDRPADEGGRCPDLRPLALLVATVVLIGIAAAAPTRRVHSRPRGVFPLPRLGAFAGEVLHKTAPSAPRAAAPAGR